MLFIPAYLVLASLELFSRLVYDLLLVEDLVAQVVEVPAQVNHVDLLLSGDR